MRIDEITNNKTDFMEILLIGDEEEAMINRYLEQSQLFVLYDNNMPISVCAILYIDDKIIEIKNLATRTEYQNKGYASRLLDFIFNKYKDKSTSVILGTGENEKTFNFYKKRSFVEAHRIKNFFINNYSHPIIENGKQLVDMIYLKKIYRKIQKAVNLFL